MCPVPKPWHWPFASNGEKGDILGTFYFLTFDCSIDPPGEFMLGSEKIEQDWALKQSGGGSWWADVIPPEGSRHRVTLRLLSTWVGGGRGGVAVMTKCALCFFFFLRIVRETIVRSYARP